MGLESERALTPLFIIKVIYDDIVLKYGHELQLMNQCTNSAYGYRLIVNVPAL